MTNITTIREHGLVSPVDGVVLHDTEVRLPVLTLAQANSQTGSPGKLVKLDTGEEFDGLKVVPIMIQAIRQRWPEGKQPMDGPSTCMSINGHTPVLIMPNGDDSDSQNIDGDGLVVADCETCPFFAKSAFANDADAGFCSPEYVAVIMLDTGEPVLIRLRRTSLRLATAWGNASMFRQRVFDLWVESKVSSGGFPYYNLKTRPLSADPVHDEYVQMVNTAQTLIDTIEPGDIYGSMVVDD